MLQDMAVPAHVRNDFSPGHMVIFPEWASPKKWPGNPFEKYVQRNNGREWFDSGPIKCALSNPRLTDFWDTHDSSGINPATVSSLLGLSEYTQINFFSRYSIFSPDCPYPREEDCVYFTEPPYDSFSHERKYLSSTNGHPEERVKYLATVGYLQYYNETMLDYAGPQLDAELTYLTLDDKCYGEYASKLVPRAIGYSANLIDYFFRGKLEVTAEPSSQSFELKIKNATPTQEEMSDGQFSLTVRYTPDGGNSDGSDDVFVRADDVVKSGVLAYNQEADYHFDLIESIPEENLDSAKCILAFKGKLGNEENAVIGIVQDIIAPCLVIELDGEFVLWDINRKSLLSLVGDAEYPLDAAGLNQQIEELGLIFKTGLGYTVGESTSPTPFDLEDEIGELSRNWETVYETQKGCPTENPYWDIWDTDKQSVTDRGYGYGTLRMNCVDEEDGWYSHDGTSDAYIEMSQTITVPSNDSFIKMATYTAKSTCSFPGLPVDFQKKCN
ncbi:MAG: hypothetical protein WAZ60_20365 [Desulfosalsimonadaceae bacterium]